IGAVVAASFTAHLEDNVAGRPLTPAARRAVDIAKDRPLAGRADLPPSQRPTLGPAVERASESAFHLGIGIAVGLMLAAALIAAVGVESGRRRAVGPGRADLALALHPCPDEAPDRAQPAI